MLKVASFFSGIGGFDLGFENAGMKVVFQSEINNFCRQVLKKHWVETKLTGDINTLTGNDIPEADVWCGGFPCQDVSLANQGKRKGLEGERRGLFFKFAELIKEKTHPGSSLKTFQDSSTVTTGKISKSSSIRWANSGILVHGEFSMQNILEYPKDAEESTLELMRNQPSHNVIA